MVLLMMYIITGFSRKEFDILALTEEKVICAYRLSSKVIALYWIRA